MTLNIQSRDIDVTDSLHAHAHQETRHLSERFPHLRHVWVRLKVRGSSHIADVLVLGKKTNLRVEASSADMYVAIHQARVKAERRLHRLYDSQFRFGNSA
jgi:ribosomal subunit interface protein